AGLPPPHSYLRSVMRPSPPQMQPPRLGAPYPPSPSHMAVAPRIPLLRGHARSGDYGAHVPLGAPRADSHREPADGDPAAPDASRAPPASIEGDLAGADDDDAGAELSDDDDDGVTQRPASAVPPPLGASPTSGSGGGGAAYVKPKRRRANAEQLAVLNSVLETTFFPSTELRQSLARRLGMTPRAVQIWFQNKRQNWRTAARGGQSAAAAAAAAALAAASTGDGASQSANAVTIPVPIPRQAPGAPPPLRHGDGLRPIAAHVGPAPPPDASPLGPAHGGYHHLQAHPYPEQHHHHHHHAGLPVLLPAPRPAVPHCSPLVVAGPVPPPPPVLPPTLALAAASDTPPAPPEPPASHAAVASRH
ncbi:hypothetical protein HK405_009459, partial [Cladochytrium tenue]